MLRSALLRLAASPEMKRIATEWPVARRVAGRFVAGPTLEDALDQVERLNRGGMNAALNFLGEHTHSEREAYGATDMYLSAIDAIPQRGFRAYCSVKPSQVGMLIDPGLCERNVRLLVARAQEGNAFIRLDMEDSSQTDATLNLARSLWADGARNIGVVLQAYLYRTERDLQEMNALGMSVRLCKGAYAEDSSVAYPDKADVDRNYARLMTMLLRDGHHPAMATHDPRLLRAAIRYARQNGISSDAFSFEMLLGIRRDLQEKLITLGNRVTVYVPFGSEWYPYLTRRLAERPANLMFFLRAALRG